MPTICDELKIISKVLSRTLDALESDSDISARLDAFTKIQDLFDPGCILARVTDYVPDKELWEGYSTGHFEDHPEGCTCIEESCLEQSRSFLRSTTVTKKE